MGDLDITVPFYIFRIGAGILAYLCVVIVVSFIRGAILTEALGKKLSFSRCWGKAFLDVNIFIFGLGILASIAVGIFWLISFAILGQ